VRAYVFVCVRACVRVKVFLAKKMHRFEDDSCHTFLVCQHSKHAYVAYSKIHGKLMWKNFEHVVDALTVRVEGLEDYMHGCSDCYMHR
jgi:hypothetical protein